MKNTAILLTTITVITVIAFMVSIIIEPILLVFLGIPMIGCGYLTILGIKTIKELD